MTYQDLSVVEIAAWAVIVAGCVAGLAILSRRSKPPPISPRARARYHDAEPAIDTTARDVTPPQDLPWCPRSLEAQRLYGYPPHRLDAIAGEPGTCIICGPVVNLDPWAFVRYDDPDQKGTTMTDSRCRSCDAPILWAITKKERRIPLDKATVDDDFPIRYRIDADGYAVPVDDGPGHLAHFATCPNARTHRRPR